MTSVTLYKIAQRDRLIVKCETDIACEVWVAHRLARPFLGVGVLGGFTTFSTYAVETRDLLQPGTVGVAFGYLAGTLFAALAAVIAGVWLTRAITGAARDPDRRR